MSTNFELTRPAIEDIKNIDNYSMSKWGVMQADEYLDGLDKKMQLLATTPEIGIATYKDLLKSYYKQHVIFYLQKNDSIIIVRVLHKNMDNSVIFHS